MAKLLTITPSKTYATAQNAQRAVDKVFPSESDLRYIMMRTEDGRFYPLFIGMSAIEAGVHFHFNVVN